MSSVEMAADDMGILLSAQNTGKLY